MQDATGQILAVFADALVANTYADAREDRRVVTAPLIAEGITLRTVHTRWLEVDAGGQVRVDHHGSYQWCEELDDIASAPSVELEQSTYRGTRTLMCVGTDDSLINAQLDACLQQGMPKSA